MSFQRFWSCFTPLWQPWEWSMHPVFYTMLCYPTFSNCPWLSSTLRLLAASSTGTSFVLAHAVSFMDHFFCWQCILKINKSTKICFMRLRHLTHCLKNIFCRTYGSIFSLNKYSKKICQWWHLNILTTDNHAHFWYLLMYIVLDYELVWLFCKWSTLFNFMFYFGYFIPVSIGCVTQCLR